MCVVTSLRSGTHRSPGTPATSPSRGSRRAASWGASRRERGGRPVPLARPDRGAHRMRVRAHPRFVSSRGVTARWGTVAAYAAVAAANQLLWLTYAPITTATAEHFGVSESAVGWLSQVFPLLYVILAIPAGLLLDRHFRSALLTGAWLTAAGGALRLGSDTFAAALAGQLLIAVAQPLILNAVTKVAVISLPPADRTRGISLGSAG